jgi:hypothetical protein
MWKAIKKIAAKADEILAKSQQAKRDPGIYEDWKPAKPKTSPVTAVAAKPMPPAPTKPAPTQTTTARPTGTVQRVYSKFTELKEEALNNYAKRDPLMLSHLLDKQVQRGEMPREQATWIMSEVRKRRGR